MFGSSLFLGLFLILSIGLAIAGLLIVRRYVDHETLMSHHDVAGYLLTIVGTLYAVVLGLIVVGSLNTFENARLTVAKEANALQNIFHLSEGLPYPVSGALRSSCLSYAKVMVNDEWKTMEDGKASPKASEIVSELRKLAIKYEPSTQRQIDLHSSILTQLDDLADNRNMRLIAAEPVYDWIIWGVLILGGAVLVVFTYFFGVEKIGFQILMTILVTVTLSLNLFVVALFGYPYSGDVKVAPTPFEADLNLFRQQLQSQSQQAPTPTIKP